MAEKLDKQTHGGFSFSGNKRIINGNVMKMERVDIDGERLLEIKLSRGHLHKRSRPRLPTRAKT